MSQCMTCRYALYDGMCLAKGKFTTLDAPACDTYAERTDVEASRLRAENRELCQLVADCHSLLQRVCDGQDEHGEGCPLWTDRGVECELPVVERRMRELGVEL